ncbi:MAG TPA: zinc-ribbon domain-containing protein [Myxococcaceae bacterium]|jgi:hypothetical protein
MTLIQFTRNYSDHSNDKGYQFEFFCDKCGNGFRSSFNASTLGMAASVLQAASSVFGGFLRGAARGAGAVQDALRGEGWDSAFNEAVTEAKPKFRQCTRCGKWVCPEVCWNEKRSLCESCAPDLAEEAASIQAHVAVEQIGQKMRQADQVGEVDVKAHAVASCPHCRARVEAGQKFCPECGKPVAAQAAHCTQCGTQLPGTAKFCPGCGAPRSPA